MQETLAGGFPKQKLSYAEKIKNKYAWAKSTINYLIFAQNLNTPTSYSKFDDYKRKSSNYKLYNNQIDEEDIKTELNTIVFDLGQTQDSIQPYNKTYNKINVLLGEEIDRKWNFKVIQTDPSGLKMKLKKKKEMLRKYLLSELQMEMDKLKEAYMMENPVPEDAQGQQQYMEQMNAEVDRVMNPQEIEKYINTEYLTGEEIKANKILRFLQEEQKLKLKKNKGFKDGLIAGEEFGWIGIEHGKPVCKMTNPLGMFYHKSPEVQFIQDGLFAGFRTRMHIGDVLDTYGPYMTKEELDELETIYAYVQGLDPYAINDSMQYKFEHLELQFFGNRGTLLKDLFEGSYGAVNFNDFEVTHVEWVSERKIGWLTYTDPNTGEEILDICDESYKPNKEAGESVEWEWIPEVWEGTRINNCYVNIGPKLLQFRDLSDLETADIYRVKLGYHGLVYENNNARPVSLMDRMKPYQYLFFAAMKKLEKLLKSDKGNKIPIDVTMIDKDMGMETFLHYFENSDYYFYNPLQNAEKPGSAQRPGIQGIMAMSNAQSISNYIPFLQYLEAQINEQAGVSKQREGQTSSQEAVTNAQQNIVQSSYITKIYFMLHDELWKEMLTSLLQAAQLAYSEQPLLVQYTLDDLSRSILELNPGELDHARLGIFVTDGGNELLAFNDIKAMSQAILQNPDAKVSKLIKVYTALSLGDLEREIKALEAEQDAIRQSEQQATLESQERMAQIQVDMENKKLEMQKYKIDSDNETKLLLGELQALGFQSGEGVDNTDLIVKQAELGLKQQEASAKNFESQQKLAIEKETKSKELAQKDREIRSKEKIEQTKLKMVQQQNASQEKMQDKKAKLDEKMADAKIKLAKIQAKKKTSTK
jgi:hypothetical protein